MVVEERVWVARRRVQTTHATTRSGYYLLNFNFFFGGGLSRCFLAGNCWLQQGKNGRCQVLYMPGMSREECCRSGRLGTSWTEEDVPNSTLFRWMIFNGGAPNCIPCKGGGALGFFYYLLVDKISKYANILGYAVGYP